jgi:arylsulfatase A-like enzyme
MRPAVSKMIAVGFLSALIGCQWFSANGIKHLVLEGYQGASQARLLYAKYFDDSIRLNQTRTRSLQQGHSQPNLFIVQLESINANLVTPEVTPNLLTLAGQQGVLFPRIQAASVFTVLSMETILCATLPTLEKNLAQMDSLHDRLNCLPRILKDRGFRTLYFQAYPNLKFNNMEQFFLSIGFDEIHAQDIMKPGDPTLKWGFVEDVFYKRVFEYLERFRNQKIFAYIVAGSANHYPFFNAEIEKMFAPLKHRLPYQAPKNVKERMANTMFIQDHFFGEMYQQLYAARFRDTSQMFVLGDHSWPTELHNGNNNNLKGAFQENFTTTMAFLPQRSFDDAKSSAIGRIVPRLYSYLDLPATVLEMYGVNQYYSYGQSFSSELGRQSESHRRAPAHCVLSVQPFSGGEIAVINYPTKYIFDLKNDSVAVHDLETDPNELNAVESVKIDAERLALLEACLLSLKARHGALEITN